MCPVLQPIVDLETGEPLFAAARSAGRSHELDRPCQTRALDKALAAGLAPPFGLFVNVVPGSVGRIEPPPALLAGLRQRGIALVIKLAIAALTIDRAQFEPL